MNLTQLDDLDMHSAAELRNAGRARRAQVPRSVHAEYLDPGNRDPLGIIEQQNADRLPESIGLRSERMRYSAFTFYRGTAAIQAADLAREVDTGARVVISGDAHLSNFGFYRSPQPAAPRSAAPHRASSRGTPNSAPTGCAVSSTIRP